jgi:hypothetical protein
MNIKKVCAKVFPESLSRKQKKKKMGKLFSETFQ